MGNLNVVTKLLREFNSLLVQFIQLITNQLYMFDVSAFSKSDKLLQTLERTSTKRNMKRKDSFNILVGIFDIVRVASKCSVAIGGAWVCMGVKLISS